MDLSTLPKTTTQGRRRLGQGHGSGRVKTSGRGTKGQKARNHVPIFFEGGALPLIKRMPYLRGKGRNKMFKARPIAVNVQALNVFGKNATIDLKALIDKKIIDAKQGKLCGVKILGNGNLTVALAVALPVSKGAQVKIEKAGGRVKLD